MIVSNELDIDDACATSDPEKMDARLHSGNAEDVAQWLYASGHHDAAATVRNQLDVRNIRIRELQKALDAHLSRAAEPVASMTPRELAKRIRRGERWKPAPHIVSSDEGTSHCALAEADARDAVGDLAAEIRADREYLHGLKQGWNLGVCDDRDQYQKIVEGRMKEIREARAEAIDASMSEQGHE